MSLIILKSRDHGCQFHMVSYSILEKVTKFQNVGSKALRVTAKRTNPLDRIELNNIRLGLVLDLGLMDHSEFFLFLVILTKVLSKKCSKRPRNVGTALSKHNLFSLFFFTVCIPNKV